MVLDGREALASCSALTALAAGIAVASGAISGLAHPVATTMALIAPVVSTWWKLHYGCKEGQMERRRLLKVLLCGPAVWFSRESLSAQSPGRVFGSDAGMVLNTIKPEKAGDFEMVMGRVKAALQQSSDPIRKQQANGWKLFKALEPGANGTVLYVFWLSPAVNGADYTISKILFEAFPGEVDGLYKKFSESYNGGQTLVNLKLLSNLGLPA